jgi:hypothetical protein
MTDYLPPDLLRLALAAYCVPWIVAAVLGLAVFAWLMRRAPYAEEINGVGFVKEGKTR